MSPEEMGAKLLKLAESYGLSPDDPAAGWKLAHELAVRYEPGFKEAAPRGQKADPNFTVEDLILLFGVEIALERDPNANVPCVRSSRAWRKITDGRPMKPP